MAIRSSPSPHQRLQTAHSPPTNFPPPVRLDASQWRPAELALLLRRLKLLCRILLLRHPARQPADTKPEVAPTAPDGDLAQGRPPVAAARNRDVLFLQRPGVNIRSAPSLTSTVVGTAPKGTRFDVITEMGNGCRWRKLPLMRWPRASIEPGAGQSGQAQRTEREAKAADSGQ